MYISIRQTIARLERCLPENGTAGIADLRKMYDLALRLQSQLLGVIYDIETFSVSAPQEREKLAEMQSAGKNENAIVTLTIYEPLPSMKKLTEALEEHWKAMIHAAISEAAQQGPLPYYKKAFVEITIITPRGSNNANVWDTSNRAINVVINNLKGIFFRDDNIEHMAFSVVGLWGDKGATILHISEMDESAHIESIRFCHENGWFHED